MSNSPTSATDVELTDIPNIKQPTLTPTHISTTPKSDTPLQPPQLKQHTPLSELKTNSMNIIRLRKLHLEEQHIEFQRQLLEHDTNPCKRKFYCSDYCRIRTIMFISESDSSVGASLYGYFLILTIMMSYIMAITETFRDTAMNEAPYMAGNLKPNTYLNIQSAFVTIFALDTLVRFSLTDSWFFRSKITDAQRTMDPLACLSHKPFFFDLWNWVDIVSILVVFLVGFSASFFIVLRVFRPIRNLPAFRIIIGTMRASSGLLTTSTFFLFSLMVVFSFLIIAFESCYNNDCQFVDLFSSAYFIVITMTSVGFGDQIPTAAMARVVAMVAMLIGSFYLAMPLAIVGSQFESAWAEQEAKTSKKRSASENKLLESIREKRLTLNQRRQRVVVHSYQALDTLHSVECHIRSFANEQRGSKLKLHNSFHKLFASCGKMLDELIILFPTYPIANRAKYSMALPRRGRNAKANSMVVGSSSGLGSAGSAIAAIAAIADADADADADAGADADADADAGAGAHSRERSSSCAGSTIAAAGAGGGGEAKSSSASSSQTRQLKSPISFKGVINTFKGLKGGLMARSTESLQSDDATYKHFHDVEVKQMNEAMLGISFLKKVFSTESGGFGFVPVTGAHTPDGISLTGHYWAGQVAQHHARDISINELLSKYRNERSLRLGSANQCVTMLKKGSTCLLSFLFRKVEVNKENVIYDARTNFRSKIWLIVEAPESSAVAHWTRNIRLAFTFFALGLVFVETTPEFNTYGSDSRNCKATINYYCNKISTCVGTTNPITGVSECKNMWSRTSYTQEEVNAFNPGCFANETSGYKGCLGTMDGMYSECDFPNEKVGMTMNSTLYGPSVFGEEFIEYLGKGDDSMMKMSERMQCSDGNGSLTEYYTTFWICELIFTIFFSIELVLRLYVATVPEDFGWKDWFLEFGNWIDVLAVCTALVEVIGNSINFGSPMYTVWGWMWDHTNEPMTFRFLRLIVAIRFIFQQRHFKDTKIITSTISQVINRLMVPLLLFGLLVTMFGGLLYFTEGGLLYTCSDFENPTKNSCDYCGGPPFIVPFGSIGVGNYYGSGIRAVDWTDDWLGHKEWYNGTCRFLHTAAGGAVSGVGAGAVLQTPLIIDAWDGVWTIFVVMTTVGYGGKRPHTPLGKSVVVVAAIFGAFYLAMPLTIIATAFNKNYQVHLEKQEKELIRKEKLSGSNHGGKLKFMHIVKLKLWAKRAVARAQGHHHGVDPPGKQVLNYAEALHSLANRHNYSDLVQFKSIHQDLLEHCVTIMARHMKPET